MVRHPVPSVPDHERSGHPAMIIVFRFYSTVKQEPVRRRQERTRLILFLVDLEFSDDVLGRWRIITGWPPS
jgi:hypothetical protein